MRCCNPSIWPIEWIERGGKMSPRNKFSVIIALAFGTFGISACNVGQGVKTLGSVSSATDTSSTNADAFAITLAYRDPSNDATTPNRVIALQGLQNLPSANLVKECGTTGTSCSCDFYQSSSDTSPVTSVTVGISLQNNSFSCSIPASITDAQLKANPNLYNLVKLKRVNNTSRNTGLLTIKTTLTIEDVLGPNLVKTQVRGIFSYSCSRTFFEGQGVSASAISCVANQNLGVISASYNFYTYKSGVDSNTSGGDIPFTADICKRTNFLKIQCTGTLPVLHYGFYRTSASPFVVGITMTRAPEAGTGDTQPLTDTYGYAALPDSAGNCPIGLIKVRPWIAQPASIVPASGTCPTNGCPTSFINTGNLNNTVVEAAQPANFVVTRQPNQTACSATGDCTNATFNGVQNAESVAYTSQTPVVCAIPPGLLSGLF
jgi:hypothetical protein